MPGRAFLMRTGAALAVCLVLALGGQALAGSLVPEASGADTGQAVGRAASSYLTGIRTYAAAALWNRIDPLMHSYYNGVPLDDQRYMLSTIAAVQALDPQFARSYSVGSWILAANDRTGDAVAMAERGAEMNPSSGICLSNLAQLQWLYGDRERALEVARRALEADVQWPEPVEAYTWHALLYDIFHGAGDDELAEVVADRMHEIDGDIGDDPAAHDHDGDGTPDH